MRVHSRFYGFRGWLISRCWIWVLGAFCGGAILSSAQQTSYTIQLQPGFNSIANHLVRDGNRLNDILQNLPADSMLWKFDRTTQAYYSPATFDPAFGWIWQEPQMEKLDPGEGAFLFVHQPATVTFFGNVSQLPLPPQVFEGFNFVSARQPRPMNFMELFGYPPTGGDVVYMYDNPLPQTGPPGPGQQAASSIHRFVARQGWDREPIFRVGRSAFVRLSGGPRIMQHPKSQTINAGQTLRLDVSALGVGPFRYQWHFNDDDLPGEIHPTLLVSNIHYLQSGLYSVTVGNPFGEMTSKAASILVMSPPVILEQPRSVRTTPGQLAEFRVRAVGTPTLRYQWFRNNNELIPNETNSVLKVTAGQTSAITLYQVRVMNPIAGGFVQSNPAFLEVNEPPAILQQPMSVVIPPRDTAQFTVVARGTPPLRYQWRRNGRNLYNETNSTLFIHDAQPTNSGLYQVTVGNIAGVAESDVVELIVDASAIFLADRIEDSQLYPMPFFTGRSHNQDATNESNEVHCAREGGGSVWMRWMTTNQPGIVRFETSGSTFDTIIAAYTMNATGGLTRVVCDDDEGDFLGSRIHFAAVPNLMYFIAIDGVFGAKGQIVLDWQFEPTPEFLPVIVEQPRDQTAPFGGQVMFSVLATVPGVSGPNFYIWYHNGVEIQGQNQSQLVVGPVTNQHLGYYHVEVFHDRRFVRSRRALLQISLADANNRLLEAFAVDKFADAFYRSSTGSIRSVSATAFTPVLGYTGTQIFSTVGFEGEPGELSHCGIPGGSSAWFTFIPAANGRLYLHTTGSSFNTVLAVYTGPGPTIASLTSLICDDDSGPGTTSSLNFSASAGTTYYIALDGYNGDTGDAQLHYRLLVPIALTNMIKTNATVCHLRVKATPSYPFTIQRCSGFQIWTSVLTTNTLDGTYDYRDTNATPIRRFYRAIQTP